VLQIMYRRKGKTTCFRKRHGTSADMFNPYINLCDNTQSSKRAQVPQDGGAILTDVIYFGRLSSQTKRTNISESVFSSVFFGGRGKGEGGRGRTKVSFHIFQQYTAREFKDKHN